MYADEVLTAQKHIVCVRMPAQCSTKGLKEINSERCKLPLFFEPKGHSGPKAGIGSSLVVEGDPLCVVNKVAEPDTRHVK